MTRLPRQGPQRWTYTIWLLTGLFWLVGTSVTHGGNESADERTGTLSHLTVSENDHQVVVTLRADRAFDGALEAIHVEPRQLLLELAGIVPSVDAITEVGHGVVRRVRVEFNWSNPPVTRVVLDLRDAARYSLERDTGGALSIIVHKGPDQYADWLEGTTETIERLLEEERGRRAGQPVTLPDMDSVNRWKAVQADVARLTAPAEFDEAHLALATATRLGLEAVSVDVKKELQPAKPSVALAGASLSLGLAQALAKPHLLRIPRAQ